MGVALGIAALKWELFNRPIISTCGKCRTLSRECVNYLRPPVGRLCLSPYPRTLGSLGVASEKGKNRTLPAQISVPFVAPSPVSSPDGSYAAVGGQLPQRRSSEVGVSGGGRAYGTFFLMAIWDTPCGASRHALQGAFATQ